MKAEEIMSRDVRCISPDSTLSDAARTMRELDVGALPVCDHDRLAGMITDRDIVLRAVAEGKDPAQVTVREAMSPGVVFGYADQDVEEIARIMEEHQIRRLPLLNRAKRLVGLVATADIALEASSRLSGTVLHDISTPAELRSG